ncbi:hypothetical protein [Amycolatopsis sp. NPDC059021]|uniref:hypothetical protein n=1 Tax=Amycolatopsis sp. NPDC059021 TaxID=3346704 RepID=UPI00366E53AB
MNLFQAALMALPLAALAATVVSTPARVPAPPIPMITVTIGALGARQITFTDPMAPGGLRREELTPHSAKSFKVKIPLGMTITVTLSGFDGHPVTECSIGDETEGQVYVRGTDSCSYVAGELVG